MHPDSDLSSQQASPIGHQTDPQGDKKLIDLNWLAGLAWRYKRLLVAVVGTILALAMLAFYLTDKQYEASAVVALERNDQQLVHTAQSDKVEVIDSPTVDTEVQVLLSPEMALAAVNQAKLNENTAFLRTKAPDAPGPISPDAAALLVKNSLIVERRGLSYAINVLYTSKDPEVSALVANAIADAYVGGQIQTEQAVRGQGIEMLSARLERLRGDVIKAEADVANYRAGADLVNVTNDDTIAQQELSTLNTELAAAKAELAAARGRAGANASDNGSLVNANPVVRDLRTQIATLERKLAEQSSSLGPSHPDRMRTQAELASARASLNGELTRSSQGVSNDVRIAQQRVAAIQSAIASAKGRLLAGNNASVRLNELERLADSARQLYQTFLDRYRVEMAARGTERAKATIIARARVPRLPSSPDILVYLLGGIIGGFIVAMVAVLILEWRERGIRNRTEAEEFTGLRVVSSLPDIATMDEPGFDPKAACAVPDFLVAQRDTPFSEAIRSIWTSLQVGQTGQEVRCLGVVSSIPGEGKSSLSMSLARSTALAGRKVLLIDCDHRRSGTTFALGLRKRKGLVEVLSGEITLEEAIVTDTASGAAVLPMNLDESTNVELIQTDRTRQLLERCRREYDLVILDIAPVIPVADARALAAMADSVLMVVRWRTTPRTLVANAIRELRRAGAAIYGVVLTQVDVRSNAIPGEESAYYTYYYSQTAA